MVGKLRKLCQFRRENLPSYFILPLYVTFCALLRPLRNSTDFTCHTTRVVMILTFSLDFVGAWSKTARPTTMLLRHNWRASHEYELL